MRILRIVVSIILVSQVCFGFEVKVIQKQNLTYRSVNLGSSLRGHESYTEKAAPPKLNQLIVSVVKITARLLPSKFLPKTLIINIEEEALFSKNGSVFERIPLSLIFTAQVPLKNQIRFSNYEIKNCAQCIRTILAHETGHLLMEWVGRGSGVLKLDQTMHTIWSGSIYEGVADYISAIVNQTTDIGARGAWFGRNILQYKTLEEAQAQSTNTLQVVEAAFKMSGLIPRYRSYSDMISEMKSEWPAAGYRDPYIEGSWLAGELWRLSQVKGSRAVFGSIVHIASKGQRFSDPREFLKAVVKLSL
jgi:hypothetical protein